MLRLDGHENRFHLAASRGAMPRQQADGDIVLARTFGSSKEPTLGMDEIDLSLVNWHLRQGARVVQWAKLGTPAGDPKYWYAAKKSSMDSGHVSTA